MENWLRETFPEKKQQQQQQNSIGNIVLWKQEKCFTKDSFLFCFFSLSLSPSFFLFILFRLLYLLTNVFDSVLDFQWNSVCFVYFTCLFLSLSLSLSLPLSPSYLLLLLLSLFLSLFFIFSLCFKSIIVFRTNCQARQKEPKRKIKEWIDKEREREALIRVQMHILQLQINL